MHGGLILQDIPLGRAENLQDRVLNLLQLTRKEKEGVKVNYCEHKGAWGEWLLCVSSSHRLFSAV